MFGQQLIPAKKEEASPAPAAAQHVPVNAQGSNSQAAEQLVESEGSTEESTPTLDWFRAAKAAESGEGEDTSAATPALEALEVPEPALTTSMRPHAHHNASPPPGTRIAPSQPKVNLLPKD